MTSFSPMLTTFLGHSAVFAAISEILHRGYNVALPLIDTGDDFYVYKHPGKTYARIQVKSATPHPLKTKPAHQAHFRIPLSQLHTRHQPDLIYILTTRSSNSLLPPGESGSASLTDEGNTPTPSHSRNTLPRAKQSPLPPPANSQFLISNSNPPYANSPSPCPANSTLRHSMPQFPTQRIPNYAPPTFILIPRRRLLRLHTQHNFGSISTDRLHISLTIHPHHIQSHYQNLQPHRNAFHKYFP